MLGGGGFTGGVYEIGALRALDLLAVNRTVNEFDVYVGTSAGAFVGALAANGVTPEEMMRVVNQQVPTPFRDVGRGSLMRPNYLEFAQSAALLPLRMLGVARSLVTQVGQLSIIDLAVQLAQGLPSGLYDGRAIQDYLERVLADPDRTNDFRLLGKELYLAATDLDTCERIVLGGEDWEDVRSPARWRPRLRCRCSTSRLRSRAGSWSTAGYARRLTWTSPSSAAPGS